MMTVVLDNRSLELRIDGQALALYEAGTRRGSLPIRLVDRLIIQGDLALSASVLTRLAEAGAAVLVLSKRHSRRTAVVLGSAHNDVAVRLAQSQHVRDTAWCAGFGLRQVRAKTRGQIRLLRRALTGRPDCRKALTDAIDTLNSTLARLEELVEAPVVETVRGLEGAAARAYFSAYSALFAAGLGFKQRNRRPPKDPVNACLSLVYTLLHFEAIHAAHIAGLDPLLGFYHRPAFGRESLASDLIEPLRPHADAWVWEMFRAERLRREHFSRDGPACLLGKAGREVFYQCYESFARAPRRMLRRQCQLLTRHMRRRGEPFVETVTDNWE